MKRFNTITSAVDTDLITTAINTEAVSIAAFASGFSSPKVVLGLHQVKIAYFFLATVIIWKLFIAFSVRQKKKKKKKYINASKPLAQSKLDGIADIISQAIQDEVISCIEFHKY